MQHPRAVLLFLVVLPSTSTPACHDTAHNITAILSGRRGLAEFSRALTATRLADVINSRATVTVLAVDDAHMAPLSASGLPLEALHRALSPHVPAGYYDDARLRRLHAAGITAPTVLNAPASGAAVTIARERRGGRVAFAPLHDARAAVLYVGPVHEAPHNVSVLLVSAVMWNPAARPPVSRLLKPSTAPAPATPEHDSFIAREHGHVSGWLIFDLVIFYVVVVLISAIICCGRLVLGRWRKKFRC